MNMSSVPSAEWWTQPRTSNVVHSTTLPSMDYFSFTAASRSPLITPPARELSTGENDADVDLPEEALPSSPAARFLSGFASPDLYSRTTSLPRPSRPAHRPNLPRLEVEADLVAGYRLGTIIGHGAFSTVRQATSITTHGASPPSVVAVKIVRQTDNRPGASEARLRLSHEVKIWSQLSHEHILPLFQFVEASEATYFFTLYCPAGSLLDIINAHKADGLDGVGMDDAGMLFRQIVRGLKYLHEVVRLVHCDIKLENILVDDQGSCRIADFGLSKWITDVQGKSGNGRDSNALHGLPVHLSLLRSRGRHHRNNLPFTRDPGKAHRTSESIHPRDDLPTHPHHRFPPGSLPYAAPELLAPQPTSLAATTAQDVWALGCVLYALLFGQLPFSDPFEPRLQMKIVRGIWKLPSNCGRSGPRRPRMNSNSRSRSRTRVTFARPREPSTSRTSAAKTPNSATFVSNSPTLTRNRSSTRELTSRQGRSTSRPEGKKIGRVAENVLHGSLCVSMSERWTVSMIDEVGWAVGWDLDVDEAGEEVDEPYASSTSDDITPSASGSSGASALSAGSVEAEPDHDEFGYRYYISPSVSTHPSRPSLSPLYSSTLSLVTSPVDARDPRLLHDVREVETPPECTEKAVGSMGESRNASERDTADDTGNRARSRGKRGKASRSSSRASTGQPVVDIATPPQDAEPFHVFRQSHISYGITQALAGASQPSSTTHSRAPSRPTSTVHSRAASRERDSGREWSRGRPAAANSWLGASMSVGQSSAFAVTARASERSRDSVGSWGMLKSHDSASPSPSPSPSTPVDMSIPKPPVSVHPNRSQSRGRLGRSLNAGDEEAGGTHESVSLAAFGDRRTGQNLGTVEEGSVKGDGDSQTAATVHSTTF